MNDDLRGRAMEDRRIVAVRAGFSRVIAKPFDFPTLLATIEEIAK